MTNVQNGIETLRKISTGSVVCTNVTDRWICDRVKAKTLVKLLAFVNSCQCQNVMVGNDHTDKLICRVCTMQSEIPRGQVIMVTSVKHIFVFNPGWETRPGSRNYFGC